VTILRLLVTTIEHAIKEYDVTERERFRVSVQREA